MSSGYLCLRCQRSLSRRELWKGLAGGEKGRTFVSLRLSNHDDSSHRVPDTAQDHYNDAPKYFIPVSRKKVNHPQSQQEVRTSDQNLVELFHEIQASRKKPSRLSRYSRTDPDLQPLETVLGCPLPDHTNGQWEQTLDQLDANLKDQSQASSDHTLKAWSLFAGSRRLSERDRPFDTKSKSKYGAGSARESLILDHLAARVINLRSAPKHRKLAPAMDDIVTQYRKRDLMDSRWLLFVWHYLINLTCPSNTRSMDLYFEFGHLWRLFLQNMNRRGDGGRADGKVHRHVTEVLQQHWDEEFSHEQWKIHPSQISQEEPLSGSENSFTGVVIADVISNRLSRATRDQVYQYCHRVSDGVADRKGISLAALITLNCPREAIASLRSGIGDADWSTFLAHAICGLRLTRLNLVHSWKTQNLPMPLYGDMSKQLALVHQLLNSQDYNIKNELRRAATSRDLSRAIEIWKRLSREMELGKLSQVMQQDLFDSLLNRFVQLGNIEHLMSVWNVMVRAGCKPTSQHWQRLFQACYKARDLASCKALWNQMKSSGIEPDNDLWAIYIRVLLHCRENEFAFAALQELVRTWKYKSSLKSSSPILSTTRDRLQDQSSIPREQVSSHGLAILPFNSAISGFLINERGEMAKRAFALMTAQKLAPDVNTFSHFLRYAVQHDKTDDIGTILRALRKRKIEPDVKICTILIDGIVRNNVSGFEEQSPQEQETVLNKVFDLLENAGVEPNKYTYGTILDGFLKREHPNLAVVRSVLARMSAQGLQPSPAIYTILATHYFALNPPDLSALDALSQRIKIDRTPIDHIFYDRMIEGYASIGEVEKMLMWLRRMPDEGKTPGWKALANVLRILIRGEEWTLIENLVRDVVDERGLFSKGQRGWVGQDEFWELVRQVEEEQGIELAPRGNQDHGTRF